MADFRKITVFFNNLSRQVSDFFRDIPGNMKKFQNWVVRLPNDEKAAYSAIIVGCVLIIVSFFVW